MDIDTIGKRLVKCKYQCDGISNEPEKGILPRCLIYEERPGKNGSIVVGLNPGKAKEREIEYYLKNHNTYNAIKVYWNSKVRHLKYYAKLRYLVSSIGFDGPILWTELAKCQCNENGVLPIQTMRICIDKYLRNEIELFPKYTIFGVGNTAFNFCALSFPKHFVIGIPHPTGSYGNFSKLLKNINNNKQKYIDKITDRKDNNRWFKAVKIFD